MQGEVGTLRIHDATTPAKPAINPDMTENISRPRKLEQTNLPEAAGMTTRALSSKAPSIFRQIATVAAINSTNP